MITVTLFTKNDCSLCDSLKADLLALQPKVGFVLSEIDIENVTESTASDENRSSIAHYANLLPVLDIEHGPILYSPFSYDELFDAIDEAIEHADDDGGGRTET